MGDAEREMVEGLKGGTEDRGKALKQRTVNKFQYCRTVRYMRERRRGSELCLSFLLCKYEFEPEGF